MLLVPGLHMAEMSVGGRVYLLEEGETCVLVDTGSFDGTLGAGHLVQESRHRPEQVAYILLTHAHPGHAGNAAGLRELTGARVAASRETASELADPPRRRRLFSRSEPLTSLRVDRVLEPGEVLDVAGGVEVIAAPGHTPGSLAFSLRGPGALCVGDAASLDASGLHAPPSRRCADPPLARETAQRLAGISARCLAPGHGYPLVDGRLPRKRRV